MHNKILLLMPLFILLSLSNYARANSCQQNLLEDTAWGLTSKQQTRFLSDATLPGNRSLSDGEIYDRIKEDAEKTFRKGNIRNPKVSPSALASKIRWAASCTGNDYSMLAGLIKTESTYCQFLHNRGGGDSGCGQFTGAAIGYFKNQLRLKGRKENGSLRMKETIEELMSRCAPRSSFVEEDSLAKFFNKSDDQIRKELREAKNTSLDILATAIYLKFYYSISGFYFDATSPAPGALSRYNGGGVPRYGTKVYNRAILIDSPVCSKDKAYLETMRANACTLSADTSVCWMTTPIYEI